MAIFIKNLRHRKTSRDSSFSRAARSFLLLASFALFTSSLGNCVTLAADTAATQADNAIEKSRRDQEKFNQDEVKQWERLNPQRVWYAFVSLLFTTIPLSLAVVLLMYFLRSGTDPDRFGPYFGEGQLGQFVVIILVAGNVCTLAIAGILGSSEVSAIYGGIVGYVLGKKSA